MSKQQFDFIDTAVQGYNFLWRERHVILRIAAVPFALKLMSFLLINMFGLSENFMRQGLILIPSYFAEGWMVAYLIRLSIFDERSPSSLSGDATKDQALIRQRSDCVIAGMLIYVLTKLVLSFMTGFMMDAHLQMQEITAASENPDMRIFALALFLLAMMFWLFRFVWMHIPAALGYNLRDYARLPNGYNLSLSMMGMWLICFVPFMLGLVFVSELLLSVFPKDGENLSSAYRYAMIIAQVGLELAVSIVAGTALARAIHTLMSDGDKRQKR